MDRKTRAETADADPPPRSAASGAEAPSTAAEAAAQCSPRKPGEGWKAHRVRLGGGTDGGEGDAGERPGVVAGEARSRSYGQSLRPPVPAKSGLRGLDGHARSRSMGDLRE